jgi:hypothetical protein
MCRNRIVSLALAAGPLALASQRSAAPELRETWLALFALPIGYAHLLGGFLFALPRLRRRAAPEGSPWLRAALVGATLATLLCAYTRALRAPLLGPCVLVAMLVVSLWHVIENDLALAQAYRRGLRLGPPSRGRRNASAAAWLAALLLAALATREGSGFARRAIGVSVPGSLPGLDELVAAFLLYHAFSWLLLFLDRAQSLPAAEARRLRWRLFWLHAVPLVASAALHQTAPALHAYLVMPALYLFWSVLHALQTAALRASRRAAPERMA